jgi:hypothetical protein
MQRSLPSQVSLPPAPTRVHARPCSDARTESSRDLVISPANDREHELPKLRHPERER